MTPEQEKEFNQLARTYVDAIHGMSDFIQRTGLDCDMVWDKANQMYDDDFVVDAKWSDPAIMSEHFINMVIKGQGFDFNAFKTQEEFDRFDKEQMAYLADAKNKRILRMIEAENR